MHTTQNTSFHLQRWENVGTQAIHQDHWSFFTCTSGNVIYCITCTLCKKLYIGKAGRRLGDRFQEHICDVEKDDINASRPVARRFNLPNHSEQHMAVCGLSLHQGSGTESRKTLEPKFIFEIALLILTVSAKKTFHTANLFCCFLPYLAPTNSVAPSFCIWTTQPTIPRFAATKG